MEAIKTTPKLEFEVIYADGTRKRVQEGVLFEAEGGAMTFHNGTNRVNVLFAAAEGALEIIGMFGLDEEFLGYMAVSGMRAAHEEKEDRAVTPEHRRPMPPPRPLPDLDELSRETDSAPIYHKAMVGMEIPKRLIDANNIQYHETTECHGHGLFFAEQIAYKEEIEQIPAVDAVEVVRCKDCKYYEHLEYYGGGTKDVCRTLKRQTREDDFCSYGKRRDPE